MSLDGAAIVGAFESPRRKCEGEHPFQLLDEVIRGALDDAGLTLADVDGLAVTAGDSGEGGLTEDVIEVAEYVGLRPTWVESTDIGGCSAIVQTAQAAAAIAAGLAETVVIAYAACPRRFPFGPATAMSWPIGPGATEMPYGMSTVSAYGMFAQRHMHDYGTTAAQLASIAVTFRANAALNANALFRDPITIDDVLASPVICSPLHRLDCCVVSDSGGAVVVTRSDRARDTRKRPVAIRGFGAAAHRVHMTQTRDFTVSPGAVSGPRAFAMAGVSPSDIDVAQIYDAFTITPLIALEDLGFCAKGEGGPYCADGNIAADGVLPANTDGGGLASNHPGKRGVFALIEGIRQLRGEGPGVQVPDCELSLVHGIGGFFSSSATMILANA